MKIQKDLSAIGFVLLVMTYGIFYVLDAPLSGIVAYFWDDSFFYLKIAYNMSVGNGSTFDGLNGTNGYHPLYMLYLSAFSYFIPIINQSGLKSVFVLDTVTMMLGLILVYGVFKRNNSQPVIAVICMLLILVVIGWRDYGLEIRLLFILSWSLIYILMQDRLITNRKLIFFVGVISGLIALCRLDAILFVSFVVLWFLILLFKKNEGIKLNYSQIINLCILIAPIAVLLSIYYISNWLLFSHPMTISSWLKSGSVESMWFESMELRGLSGTQKIHLLFVFNSILNVFIILNPIKRRIIDAIGYNRFLLLFILNIFSLFHMVVLPMVTDLARWYLFLPVSIILFVDVLLFDKLVFIKIKVKYLSAMVSISLVIILVALNSIVLKRPVQYGEWTMQHIKMGQWIDNNLSSDARIFQVDESGMVGYFSNRHLINGDGLVNSWDYALQMTGRDLPKYFSKNNINYVVWDEYKDEKKIRIALPTWNKGGQSGYQVLHFDKEPIHLIRFGRLVLLDISSSSVVLEDATVGLDVYSHVGGFIDGGI